MPTIAAFEQRLISHRKRAVRDGAANTGDDIAGIVEKVGKNVYEFKPGDRVAAFHEMGKPAGSFAEYAVAWQHTTFHLPHNISFEQAATIPLAAMTSAIGLYLRLGLSEPWSTAKPAGKQPLLVYGAASAVGAFAIQFANLSGIHPIIGVAGRGIPFAESLIDKSKGDAIIDYRDGDEAVVSGIKKALEAAGCGDIPLRYCYDAISEKGSHENSTAVLDPKEGHVTYVLPIPKGFAYPEGVKHSLCWVGSVHNGEESFGYVWFRFFSRLLAEGQLKPHPFEERGGLEGLSAALKDLQSGKASATKYVFKIGETN